MNFEIMGVDGHYEVYIEGEFYCSVDTYNEAIDEVDKYLETVRNRTKNPNNLGTV